jgi:hypothetical protein
VIQWLDEFYGDPELRSTLMESFLPAFSSYVSEAVGGPVASTFITALAESYVDRHLGSSRAQLQEVLKDDESLAALQARFDEWEEKRPTKVAKNELVRSANAAQVEQMRSRGVTRKVWVASGGSCPYCTGLDGRVVGIEETFFGEGDEYAPEGAESPMTFSSSIGHPPVHQGCDCSISESLETTVVEDTRPPAMVGFEDEMRQQAPKVEHGAVFDAEGNLLWQGKGTKQSVNFPAEFMQRGNSVTHMHPRNDGYRLSSVDVGLAIDRKLGVMRSFTQDGTWMEVRVGDYAFNSDRFMRLFKTEMKTQERAYNTFAKDLLAGAKPTAETQALLDVEWHAAYGRALQKAADTIGIELREGTS